MLSRLLLVTLAGLWNTEARAATIQVPAGGDLQAAIYAAAPGDTIILQAGATYTGGFVLPAKYGDAYITIRTSTPDAQLPAGVRATPADGAKLARIITPGSGLSAIRTDAGAHHYRLIGLEIAPANAQAVVYEMVALGTSGPDQSTLASVPHHITIERCYIHGLPNANFKRGVGLNSAYTDILDSTISDFHSDYQDSQAIGGFNGPGPFRIVNNRLEGAAENILFGGSTPSIPNLVPSNVEISRNHFYKPLAWKPGEAGSTSYRPWIKNLFEIKSGQDFVIDGNIFENNWVQADQRGTAIVLSPRSEGGAAPWAVVQRITFTNNRIRNVGGGVAISARDEGSPNLIATNNITFRNNLFERIRNDYSYDVARVVQITGCDNVTFDHNTILHAVNFFRGYGAQTTGFAYTNNLTHYGSGLWTDCGTDQSGLACRFPGAIFARNALVGAPAVFGANNFYPANEAAVGFANYAGGDYRLAAGSLLKAAGTDGKDVGADIDQLEAAYLGGVVTTPSPAPTPTPVPTPAPTPMPTPTPVAGLQFYPLPRPVRLLDTRAGEQACNTPGAPLAGGQSRPLVARTTCDGLVIPAAAQAVVGNAAVVNTVAGAQAGHVTLYPSGAGLPTVSNLNYLPGQIVPNSFTVGLGADGAFLIRPTSTTHLVVDITGYYAAPGAGGLYYHPLATPVRLLDTRAGETACDTPNSPLQAGQSRVQLARTTCAGQVIPASARAIVGNAAVVNNTGSGAGFVTLYPSGVARPLPSNLNYVAGQVVPNSFTVGLGADGAFQIYAATSINFVIDVTGYYSDQPGADANGAAGLLYRPLSSPVRLLDTRAGETACDTPGVPLAGGQPRAQQARTTCSGVAAGARAIVGNAAVVNNNGSGAGFVTLYPSGTARPLPSNLNYVAGQVVPNSFTVGLGADGAFQIYATTNINFVLDIAGYFAEP